MPLTKLCRGFHASFSVKTAAAVECVAFGYDPGALSGGRLMMPKGEKRKRGDSNIFGPFAREPIISISALTLT